MIEVITVPKNDSKWERFKSKCRNAKEKVKCFWAENKEAIITLTPVVIGGITVLAKVITKQQKIHQEQVLKDLYVWDPTRGFYWVINRKLSTSEKLEFDRRVKAGECRGDILASMKVLRL